MSVDQDKGKSDVIVVRKINKTIYKKFREQALKDNRNIGDALNQAMAEWLKKQDEQGKPQLDRILGLNGIVKTRETVRWSEEIDVILYGESP